MNSLSPKKYIETKARTLPLHKCLVNKNWKVGKIADVVVMRKHVNGNITAGVYLVDLLCLGVKDTFFFFNESEEEINERLNSQGSVFKEIDYDTAHNIIYAAHDFAMDYEIRPHKEFAVTKFILEEDDDKIPLIEVETGEDGIPHLMLDKPGQYPDALSKLKKYAGEGNYYCTYLDEDDVLDEEDEMDDEDMDDEEEEDEEDEDEDDEAEGGFSEYLDDYEKNTINPLTVCYISDTELLDLEKISSRSESEQLTIFVEKYYRFFKMTDESILHSDDVEDRPEFVYINQAIDNFNPDDIRLKRVGMATAEMWQNNLRDGSGWPEGFFEDMLQRYAEDAWVICNLYHFSFFMRDKTLRSATTPYLEKIQATEPSAELTLALGALLLNEEDSAFSFIYDEPDIEKVYPGKTNPDHRELGSFFLIHALVSARNHDVRNAFHFYKLAAYITYDWWIMREIQSELCSKLAEVIDAREFSAQEVVKA